MIGTCPPSTGSRIGLAVPAGSSLARLRIGDRLPTWEDVLRTEAGWARRRHVGGTVTRLVLELVRDRGGSVALDRVVHAAGDHRPLEYLLDEHNWSSYEQARRIVDAAAEELGAGEELLQLADAALDTAVAVEEAREQERTRRALLELSRELADIASTEESAAKVARAIAAAIDCDHAAVVLFDQDLTTAQVVATQGFDPAASATLRGAEVPLEPEAFAGLRVIGLDDATPGTRRLMELTGVEAVATAPIVVDGVLSGCLVAAVDAHPERLASPQSAELLDGLAAHASAAVNSSLRTMRVSAPNSAR